MMRSFLKSARGMMRQSFRPVYCVIALVALMLQGCDVHQWPQQRPDEDVEKIAVPLRLVFDPDFYVWEHHYDPILGKVIEDNVGLDVFPEHPGTSWKYTNIPKTGFQKIHVKAYLSSNRSVIAADETFVRSVDGTLDTDVNIMLEPGVSYDIVAWSHLIPDADGAAFYDPSDFNRVSIIPDNYVGNTDLRDAFGGRVRAQIDETAEDATVVRMRRPMGKFELLTTDLSEFLDRETSRRGLPSRARADEYTVIISFPAYYPSSYSVIEDHLENSLGGVGFRTRMTVTGESEASLGFEYVLLNDISDSGVQTRVDIYDLQGTHVAGSSTITVPMSRDRHTLLRGAFLSTQGSGGVGIDPGFTGDHNVIW